MYQLLIQHHPKRSRYLDLLIHSLGREAVIVADDTSTVSGMVKCLEYINLYKTFPFDKPTHLIILQDDILPCKDFLATCERLIEVNPNNFISMYSANDAVSRTVGRKSWLTINSAYGLCAYIIPSFIAEEYLLFDPKIKDSITADDVRMSVFLRHTNRKVWVTCPSLVEHICWHTNANGGKAGINHRVASEYIGYENSGLDIDWTKGLDDPDSLNLVADNYLRHLK
jgi:hypothetical protein